MKKQRMLWNRHFLIRFEWHSDRESAENTENVLSEVGQYIPFLGSKVFSVIK